MKTKKKNTSTTESPYAGAKLMMDGKHIGTVTDFTIKTLQITRVGTWPVFRYILRGKGVYHTLFMDDQNGNIMIYDGNQHYWGHYWGKEGRGTETLRQFLARQRAPFSYVANKFSYGLSHFDARKAADDLLQLVIKKTGTDDELDWPEDVADLMDNLPNNQGSWGQALINCEGLMDLVNCDYDELPTGMASANPDVLEFCASVWPEFVQHLQVELEQEGLAK